MKHLHSRKRATYVRNLFISALLLLGILAATNVQASGAKLPTSDDGSVIADTAADTGGSVIPPATTTPPTRPKPPVTPAPTPTPPATGGGTISEEYAHIDPGKVVPKGRLAKALKYFDDNKSRIKNKEVIVVIDFSQHSSKERFYLIDMSSGRVETYQVAHGKGSDPDGDGYATQFSNQSGSQMSSQGIYIAAETYYGGNGYSLMLDGKSSTNSNARSRAVVIHPADYVVSGQKAGRSWGCPALDPRENVGIIDQIKEGAVIYAE